MSVIIEDGSTPISEEGQKSSERVVLRKEKKSQTIMRVEKNIINSSVLTRIQENCSCEPNNGIVPIMGRCNPTRNSENEQSSSKMKHDCEPVTQDIYV